MKILCVHSFAVHGTASMKAILSLLGTRVLPVPSLYLSGLTNIPGFIKTEVQFQDLLMSSLELAKERGERIILYVGYLGKANQVASILEGLETYRDIIDHLIVDPVSGDHGKIYVPQEVVDAWPKLLAKADWAFPNFTELRLFSGIQKESVEEQTYTRAFEERFPQLSFIVTSFPTEEQLALALVHEGQTSLFQHKKVDAHYGGTGDVFVAYFIFYAFYEKISWFDAMKEAAQKTLSLIESSLSLNSPDLLILPRV